MPLNRFALVCALLPLLAGAQSCSDTPPEETPPSAASKPSASATSQPANVEQTSAPRMVPVFPVPPGGSATPGVRPALLNVGQGRFFSYALPEGWRVVEDGQFAVSLVAPDSNALTVMVGNAGFPPNYSPSQFVFEKLTALAPQNLQLSQPRSATPIGGFAAAYEFDVSYFVGGVQSVGLAKAHIAPAYDSAVYVMTLAVSTAPQWPAYAPWLPLVAEQIAATDGAAFGARGIMAQNLQNSTAYAEAAREYRAWSQRTQQQVTSERNASVDQRNQQFRETLGGVQTYQNPFGGGGAVELPDTFSHYWSDPQGNFLGTDDPSANPNVGSTVEWRRMQR